MSRLLDMFCKKQPKTIDMSTGELIEFKPVSLWTKVKHISVDTISGRHDYYKDARYRITGNALIISNDKDYIFYNMDNVIKYFCEPEDNPPHS